MFAGIHIHEHLTRVRDSSRRQVDLLSEADKILRQDLLSGKNVLDNLGAYNKLASCLEEEEVAQEAIFRITEIRETAVNYRLKFLESKYYKPEIPYEATLKIARLNEEFRKDLREFSLLSEYESFSGTRKTPGALLFVKTNYDNYYLVHAWGTRLPWYRRVLAWPLKRFETLILTVILATLVLAMALPTRLITLDHQADYWSGYRAAAFFHLLIFNAGVTVYFTFAFARNLSSTVWDRYKDFG